MENGIYHMAFSSDYGNGSGVIVINDLTLNGGDHGFTYSGRLQERPDKTFGIRLSVRQYEKNEKSVFGTSGNFELDLKLSATTAGDIAGQGHVVTAPTQVLRFRATFVDELAK